MRFVQQPIERLALPPDLDLEIRLQSSGDRVQGLERNASDRTSLDSADSAVRHAGALGEVDLAQLLPATQGTNRAAEPEGVHRPSVSGGAYPTLHSRLAATVQVVVKMRLRGA